MNQFNEVFYFDNSEFVDIKDICDLLLDSIEDLSGNTENYPIIDDLNSMIENYELPVNISKFHFITINF
jgi:hypothetical protein